ncbi:hypothetical protein A7U60_g5284 [Sanghuangporus baumii]|uniref:PPM-type phosphatase domain-containing protein n=1 Tax=Sanghuangporus baumii TaxID=108892 RepID=A0A9Q5HX07_SANBA|nr:hypothetical protein A7U60_g5284 [Sanghuangporus baumii]
MQRIQTTKRLYSIAASPPLKSAVRATPTSPRPRRASLSLASAVSSSSSSSAASGSLNVVGSSGSRSLYTSAPSPLHCFDSAPPPPPSSSRPNTSQLSSSSSRLSLGESQSQTAHPNSSGNGGTSTNSAQTPHSPYSSNGSQLAQQTSHGQSQHGQTNGGQQAGSGTQTVPGSSLMLSLGGPAPPPGSSPPDHNFLLNGPRSGLAANPSWRMNDTAPDTVDTQARGEDNVSAVSARGSQKIFQLEVGAYGIPKRGRETIKGRACFCPSCLEEEELFSLESLDRAVQVGEDAYFVRDDALGVADGVGGWGSRHTLNRPASGIHSCSTCAAASTSKLGHHPQMYRHSHRVHPAQPSPSALFARRLMHFCSHEVGEARAAMTTSEPGKVMSAEQHSEVFAMSAKPSLKHGGLVPCPGRQKTVVREHGNARPFNWPWEIGNAMDSSSGLGALLEEDFDEALSESASQASSDATLVASEDPFEGTIDPVDVLERAYNKTLDAHQIRHRIRVVKEQKKAPRWWSYGLGLGSGATPSSKSTSLHDAVPIEADQLEDKECEWQELWEPLTVGSSTALLAVLSGDRLRVAHLGDCVGWLVRAGEIVWRSEEMWWGFNYPVQLGPSSPSRPADARRYELSVQADDILILASDGVSDNCWEEDVLDEVRRAIEVHRRPLGRDSSTDTSGLLGRRTLAGMLSEALCSRARQMSLQTHHPRCAARRAAAEGTGIVVSPAVTAEKRRSGNDSKVPQEALPLEELPFERRAREEGRSFRGGKSDDISVLVAIISPVENAKATRGDSSTVVSEADLTATAAESSAAA